MLGVLPGLVGTIQATEAIKLILGMGDTLAGRLLLVDALRMQFRTIQVGRDPECPACGTRELRSLVDYDEFCQPATSLAATVGESASSLPAHISLETSRAPRSTSPPVRRVLEITPRELDDRLRRGDALEVVDVREPYEWRIARIEGARLIPLARVAAASAELARDRDIVLYCHHGQRSRTAGQILVAQGFDRVLNLTGGIARWSAEVDSSVPTY